MPGSRPHRPLRQVLTVARAAALTGGHPASSGDPLSRPLAQSSCCATALPQALPRPPGALTSGSYTGATPGTTPKTPAPAEPAIAVLGKGLERPTVSPLRAPPLPGTARAGRQPQRVAMRKTPDQISWSEALQWRRLWDLSPRWRCRHDSLQERSANGGPSSIDLRELAQGSSHVEVWPAHGRQPVKQPGICHWKRGQPDGVSHEGWQC